MSVQDVDRPDVGVVQPKMQAICDQAKELTGLAPVLSIKTDDNMGSSVLIRGSHTPREEWPGGIYENGLYFTIFIWPKGGKRYYEESDDKVTVELATACYKLTDEIGNLRKYTDSVDKVLEKIAQWLQKPIGTKSPSP